MRLGRAGRQGRGGSDGGAAIGLPRAQADAEATEQAEPEPPPEPRGSEDWRVTRTSFQGELAAYTTHASGVPGTRVGLKVSTTEGGWEAAAFRIGSYEGGTGMPSCGSPASGGAGSSRRRATRRTSGARSSHPGSAT